MTNTTAYRPNYPKHAATSRVALRERQISLVEMSDKLAKYRDLLLSAKAEGKKTIPNPFHRTRS